MRIGLLSTSFLALFVTEVLVVSDAHVFAENGNTQIRLNGGMEARVNFVGRSKDHGRATAALTLMNKGRNTFYLMLVGPVSAIDNAGASFNLLQASGVAVCPWVGATIQCVDQSNRLLQSFTQVDPDTDITINFSLQGNGSSKGPVMSFSSVFAVRIVPDPIRDATLSDTQRLSGIRTMNVSFASVPVTDEAK